MWRSGQLLRSSHSEFARPFGRAGAELPRGTESRQTAHHAACMQADKALSRAPLPLLHPANHEPIMAEHLVVDISAPRGYAGDVIASGELGSGQKGWGGTRWGASCAFYLARLCCP